MWLFEVIINIVAAIIKETQDNGVKHSVIKNDDGTVTLTTKVMYKGEKVKEWDETADKYFLGEMKSNHKKEGKELLKNKK